MIVLRTVLAAIHRQKNRSIGCDEHYPVTRDNVDRPEYSQWAICVAALFHVVFGCRPDQGRDACRNSANASIVSQRLHSQRRFYLRPKFRQLQRLLGPAYLKSATPKETNSPSTLIAEYGGLFSISRSNTSRLVDDWNHDAYVHKSVCLRSSALLEFLTMEDWTSCSFGPFRSIALWLNTARSHVRQRPIP